MSVPSQRQDRVATELRQDGSFQARPGSHLGFEPDRGRFDRRPAQAADPWIVFDGADGPGKGKHIVLVSGDEEYRSEEALPQLAKILATRHGFKCTVLFAIGKDGTIDPNRNDNIPGLEALRSADLMIIATRFRNLPDEQMKEVVDYVESGRPILGMRTATHAFQLRGPTYAKYTWNSKNWPGGSGARCSAKRG